MPISRGTYLVLRVSAALTDAPRALQGPLSTAGPSSILFLAEAGFRVCAEAGWGLGAEGWPWGSQALWHLDLLLSLPARPASLSHPDPAQGVPPLSCSRGACSTCRRACRLSHQASGPLAALAKTASAVLVLRAGVPRRGQLLLWVGCRSPARAVVPRGLASPTQLQAAARRGAARTRTRPAPGQGPGSVGELCLLSPGVHQPVHWSICRPQSLGPPLGLALFISEN